MRFKPARRNQFLTIAVFGAVYLFAYFFTVEATDTGLYRTVDGLWPKSAVYVIGKNVSLGNVRRYAMDEYTHPLFYPINQLDRQIRRSYWLESTNWWND